MGQLLLIPDPRPLDERLGGKFFKRAPERPGVYLMRDAADKVLYVGKAVNLRQRLQNYRIANPDRMPRRHLRMVRQVARIEFQLCPGESAALKRESKLLRSLKPKFNRAGVWPGRVKFFAWRTVGETIELTVTEAPEAGWRRFGPLNGAAHSLHGTLCKMLWLAVNPHRGITELPTGWSQGRFAERVSITGISLAEKVIPALDDFFWAAPDPFLEWLGTQFAGRTHPFERGVIDLELETLREFSTKHARNSATQQLALL